MNIKNKCEIFLMKKNCARYNFLCFVKVYGNSTNIYRTPLLKRPREVNRTFLGPAAVGEEPLIWKANVPSKKRIHLKRNKSQH